MSSELKPITLWGGVMGPNPSKVGIVLTELNIPFICKYVPFNEVKGPEYVAVNPNGRLPAMQDPNKGITIWESGAIIEYLIAEYDHEHKLSFPAGTVEDYHCKQWLYFQVSGQGPYYGQANWFKMAHPEKVQSAIDRYVNEIRRISKVLDTYLKDRQYLVEDKCTYADVSFIPWQAAAKEIFPDVLNLANDFPNLEAWYERLLARPAADEVMKEYAHKKAEIYGKKH